MNGSITALGDVVLGGVLVGLALASLRILTGRVMSASGMLGSLLDGREGVAAPSVAFMAGLFIAPTISAVFDVTTPKPVEPSWLLLIAGGVLVGFGARLGERGLVGAVWNLARRSGWAAAAISAGVAISLLAQSVLGHGGAA